MCTVSWRFRQNGYDLFCNRDERHQRAPALPPSVHVRDGVKILAPRDGHRAGAWLASNELGVSVCLLNGAVLGNSRLPERRAYGQSRGSIVMELSSSRSGAEAMDRLSRIPLHTFAPFTLTVLEPAAPVALAEWDGARFSTMPGNHWQGPLVSSSFDQSGAQARRQCEWRRCGGEPAAFHRSHWPEAGPYSVCMHREDASTVSFSLVTITGKAVQFLYHDGPPCETASVHLNVVARRNR